MATSFFFVLGGFGLTLGYKDKVLKPDFNYRQYLTRRLTKFYPPHWICLIAAIPLALISFRWLLIPTFFVNAALLQTWFPFVNVYFSFNAVSWYLANTMFFAIVFPLLCRVIVKHRTSTAIFFIVAYILLAVLMPSEYYHYGFYINPLARTLDFVVGIYTALAFIRLCEKKWIASVMQRGNIIVLAMFFVIATMVYVIYIIPTEVCYFTVIYWSPVVFVILNASLLGKVGGTNLLRNNYLVALGDSVFTFFLVHQLVIRYYKLLTVDILHYENDILTTIICLIVSIAVSLIINKYLLTPFTQWLTKKILPSMTARS